MPIKKKTEVPEPIHTDPDGNLTRAGALAAARKLHGPLASISSDEMLPRLVWKIGSTSTTMGRGRTWEAALAASAKRKAKKEKQCSTTSSSK